MCKYHRYSIGTLPTKLDTGAYELVTDLADVGVALADGERAGAGLAARRLEVRAVLRRGRAAVKSD